MSISSWADCAPVVHQTVTMRLDLVELLERAVDVERVELVHGHAVGDQREFEVVDGGVLHRARPGNFFWSQKSAQLFGPPPSLNTSVR